MIERFFQSLKEECVWQQRFESFDEARQAVRQCIGWDNADCLHQALGYLSPAEFRTQQLQNMA